MSNGGIGPAFTVSSSEIEDLRDRGGTPWTYFATIQICFRTRGVYPAVSRPFLFRLDTGAFVSLIPQAWVKELRRVGDTLGSLSRPVDFGTVAGRSTGRLALDVPVQFHETPHIGCRFDFCVTEALNERRYGLISLRDIVNNFLIETEGVLQFGADGEPLALPLLRLYPLSEFQRVLFQCPGCEIHAWGRPGLHLVCGDCNRQLVAS
jgi:hypothetical protein